MDCESVGDCVEGGDDAAKGFQRAEGVHGSVVGYQGADLEKRGRVEDRGVEKVLRGGSMMLNMAGRGRD